MNSIKFKRAFAILWVLTVVGIAALVYAHGQEAGPSPQPSPRGEGEGVNVATAPSPIQGLVALAVPLLIAAFKKYIPADKRKWLPVVAPLLGELLASLATSLPHGLGAVAGLAGVGLREIKDQHLPAAEDSSPSGKGGADKIGAALGILLLAGVCAGSGCTGTASLVKALSKDGAVVSASINTPWGNSRLVRVGNPTNSVTVSPDGSVTVNAALHGSASGASAK